METGDLIFVRGDSLVSKAVRFFDKGEFSHVAIALSDSHILEAQYFTKSRITPMYFSDYEIMKIPLTENEQHEALEIGVDLVGKWYDYLQIIGYVLNSNFNNPRQLICSEMIALFLFRLGKINNYEEYAYLKPNELYSKLNINFQESTG